MSSPLSERNPWPMKWVALVILVCIGGYTFVTLAYRKPTRAYRPYEDMKTRANTSRLLAAGYQRVELAALRPAEPIAIQNTTFPAPGGLPNELRTTIVAAPLLATDILDVHAAKTLVARRPYPIQFRCGFADDKRELTTVELFVKGDELVLVPQLERLAGGLQARTHQPVFVITIPPATLKPGTYRATLVGDRTSRAWTLEVSP